MQPDRGITQNLMPAEISNNIVRHECPRHLADAAQKINRRRKEALAHPARPPFCRLQIPPPTSSWAPHPGFLLRRGALQLGDGWRTTRLSGSTCKGCRKGCLFEIPQYFDTPFLELSTARCSMGSGNNLGRVAVARTARWECTTGQANQIAQAVLIRCRICEFPPLTPALSPLKGEGEQPRCHRCIVVSDVCAASRKLSASRD